MLFKLWFVHSSFFIISFRKCLHCDTYVSDPSVSFLRKKVLDNEFMIPCVPSILLATDLRLVLSEISTPDFRSYSRILSSDCMDSFLYWIDIGLKGMKVLGSTRSFNCVIQLFLHLPLINSYFFMQKHNSLVFLMDCLFIRIAL